MTTDSTNRAKKYFPEPVIVFVVTGGLTRGIRRMRATISAHGTVTPLAYGGYATFHEHECFRTEGEARAFVENARQQAIADLKRQLAALEVLQIAVEDYEPGIADDGTYVSIVGGQPPVMLDVMEEGL